MTDAINTATLVIDALADEMLIEIKRRCGNHVPLTRAVVCRIAIALRDIEQVCEVKHGQH